MIKKKLIIALTATLLIGNSVISTTTFADANKNELQTIAENQTQEYPNNIFIRGIQVQSHIYHGGYIKFDVSDPENKKLKTSDMLGVEYIIHPYFGNNTYFSIKLYNPYGNLKASVDLKGNDKLSKLNQINNVGFEYGDYLKISVAQQNVLRINGNILNNQSYSGDVIPNWVLKQNHYEITEKGLKLVYENGQVSDIQQGYWKNTSAGPALILDAKFKLGDKIFDSTYSQTLLIKNAKGEVVREISGVSIDKFSENPNNLNGAEFTLTKKQIQGLPIGEYTFVLRINKDAQKVADINLVQNEDNDLSTNINDTKPFTMGTRVYTFKTENSRTGLVKLEIKSASF